MIASDLWVGLNLAISLAHRQSTDRVADHCYRQRLPTGDPMSRDSALAQRPKKKQTPVAKTLDHRPETGRMLFDDGPAFLVPKVGGWALNDKCLWGS